MFVVLNDGSTEYVNSHRDVVDIIRRNCGDDMAGIIERANWDNCYKHCYAAMEKLNDFGVTAKRLKEEQEELQGMWHKIFELVKKEPDKLKELPELLEEDIQCLEYAVSDKLRKLVDKSEALEYEFDGTGIPIREDIYR